MKKTIHEIELNRINAINPDNNLRFLINQIELDNIKTSEKDRVLNILNEIKLGILKNTELNNKLKSEIKELKKLL